MNAGVEDFYAKKTHWQTALNTLRKIILRSQLTETFKWRNPCYTIDDKNILIVSQFKAYCAVSFLKEHYFRIKPVCFKNPELILKLFAY